MAGDFAGTITLFRILGIVILLLGLGALLLALKNQLKPLIGIGIAVLAALVFIFIKLQALLSTAPAEARAFISARRMVGSMAHSRHWHRLVHQFSARDEGRVAGGRRCGVG